VNTGLNTVDVEYDPAQTNTEAMKNALNADGYEVTDIVWPYIPNTHSDITAEEADALILNDPCLYIVDVREPEDFCGSGGHIPNAKNYPWESGVLEEYYTNYTNFPEGSAVLLVSGDGTLSHTAALFLEDKGRYVYDMTGGMAEWTWETETCETSEPDDTLPDDSNDSDPPDDSDDSSEPGTDSGDGDGGGGGCFIRAAGFGMGMLMGR